MTKEILQTKPQDEILDFIRQRLAFKNDIKSQLRHIDTEVFEKEHRRFEMSGYESQIKHNLDILNEFAELGIYDYTSYLFLNFYKGHGTLYLKYFNENENLEFEFEGNGTTEIIYEIFKKTIFSNKRTR